jgi:hypothetical protein
LRAETAATSYPTREEVTPHERHVEHRALSAIVASGLDNLQAEEYAHPVPGLLPRFFARQQERDDLRRIGRILEETGELPDDALPLLRRSADGHDPSRLRGLPAIGRNVTGAIQDTDPLGALLRKEARRR